MLREAPLGATGAERQMNLDPATVSTLAEVSTATLTTILLKRGLRNLWLRGNQPLQPGQPRRVGPAFTLRFVPARRHGHHAGRYVRDVDEVPSASEGGVGRAGEGAAVGGVRARVGRTGTQDASAAAVAGGSP
jgi:hypothetical protein